MLTNTLEALQKLLEGEDLICLRQPPREIMIQNIPIPVEEELFVELPPDEEGQDYTLRLSIQKKELARKDMEKGFQKEDSLQAEKKKLKQETFLQFLLFFPFFAEETSFSDLARYLLLVNKSLEFPGFGLAESDRLVYFRHLLFFPSSRVSETMILDFIGMILLLIDAFGPNIAQIARLEKSYSEIIKLK